VKKWGPWVVCVLVFVGMLLPVVSFKQSVALEKSSALEALRQASAAASESERLRQENTTLRTEMTKEKNKSKFLREYWENGKLKTESGESSSSSEARVTELESSLADATRENSMLVEKVDFLKDELAMKYSKETERRGDVGIVLGGVFSVEPFGIKPTAGIDVLVFQVFGLSVRAGAFVTK
jgi:cell division protein FtsB